MKRLATVKEFNCGIKMEPRVRFWHFALLELIIIFHLMVHSDAGSDNLFGGSDAEVFTPTIEGSLNFQKHVDSPARLNHRYQKVENSSLMTCCWFCLYYNNGECKAINFNENTNICELNNKNVYYSDHVLTAEENWNVYNVVYDCGDPSPVSHAASSWPLTTTGSIAVYNCDGGYTPVNDQMTKSTKCRLSGHWDEIDLVCEGCGYPPEVPHASMSWVSTMPGSQALYACDEGYTPADNLVSMSTECDSNFQWDEINLVCIGCGYPPNVPNSGSAWADTTTGSTAMYICDLGYSMTNGLTSVTIACGFSGQWDEIDFACDVATMFEPCEDDSSCLEENSRCVDSGDEAIGKRCHCQPLYEYVEEERTCKQVCSGYDSTFTAFPGYHIHKYPVSGHMVTEGMSLEDCTNACITRPECLSFELTTWCTLNTLSKKQAEDAGVYQAKDTSTLYERNCLPELLAMPHIED